MKPTHQMCLTCDTLKHISEFSRRRDEPGRLQRTCKTCIRPTHQTCTKCLESKPLTEFFRSRHSRSGESRHRAQCKDCERKQKLRSYHRYDTKRQNQKLDAILSNHIDPFDAQTDWLQYAKCRGYDPETFNDTSPPEDNPGIKICATCNVQNLCLARVRPEQSHFDGVAGGRVFRNGSPVY